MAIQPPSDGLITENAQQYFQGSQGFRGDAGNNTGQSFTTTFDTDLYLGDWNPASVDYSLNNFKIYTSPTAIPGTIIFLMLRIPCCLSPGLIRSGLYPQKKSLLKSNFEKFSKIGTQSSSIQPG